MSRRARAKPLDVDNCMSCPFAHMMPLEGTEPPVLDGTMCSLVETWIIDIGPLPNCPLRTRGVVIRLYDPNEPPA